MAWWVETTDVSRRRRYLNTRYNKMARTTAAAQAPTEAPHYSSSAYTRAKGGGGDCGGGDDGLRGRV